MLSYTPSLFSFTKSVRNGITPFTPVLPDCGRLYFYEPLVQQVVKLVTESVVGIHQETFQAKIGSLLVKLFIVEMSPNDPYLTVEATRSEEVIIIVNASHPHWKQIRGAQGILNYLRHCTYDGIAEWQAINRTSRIDPDTIKILKDRLLRIPLEMESHLAESDNDEDETETESDDY